MKALVAFALGVALLGAAAPQTAPEWYQAGKTAQVAGRLDEAAADYAKALALGFPKSYVAYRMATLRIAQHDNAGAVIELQKASGTAGIPAESLVGDPALAPLANEPGFLAFVDGQRRAFHPCRYDASYRALDFWIGDWTVTNPQGQTAGTSHIEAVVDGCAIQENWTDVYGGGGKSFTSYDALTKRWDQHWVGSGGAVTEYLGSVKNGAVVMIATGPAGLTRLTFSKLPDGKVRQLFEGSTDGGKTWTIGTDLTYTPVTATKP